MTWEEVENKDSSYLERSFQFKDFSEAWAFMNRVALEAEKTGHHPDWSNSYNKVVIKLSTHDAGNKITAKDRKLAEAIDSIYGNSR